MLAAFLAYLAFCLTLPGSAAAHLNIKEQIAEITNRLETEPDRAKRATLYLRRGELHRIHLDWRAAVTDYQRARKLDPELLGVDLYLGRMMLEAGMLKRAKLSLDRFLAKKPNHVRALVTRARALVKLGEYLAAARDLTRAIAQFQRPKKPLPEYYLERAKALTAEGKEHIDEAIRGLDEGLNRLGQLVILHLYAIQLELEKGRYDAALKRLKQIAAQSGRQESWLARSGEILEQAGRTAEALQTYTQALAHIDSLPSHRRQTRSVVRLQGRLKAAVDRLEEISAKQKKEREQP
jgi:tetratricopeptide (TPR) repeat protein